jgi:hypothetical protein
MPFQLSDSTAGQQRLCIDNAQNTEIGTATPSSSLTVSGRAILNGSNLAQAVVHPQAVARLQGSVTVPAGSNATVSTSTLAGFGVTAANGGIASFSSDKTSFQVYCDASSGSQTITYAVF